MIRLLSGDCRDVLPTLPAESVQCVVCSPPYYGLRDYGTALWDGGDAACDHTLPAVPHTGLAVAAERSDGNVRNLSGTRSAREAQYPRDTCGKCGAVRVDRQIGLEATPDEYLATMVAVFREVRRVLRRDGTVWCNIGDSYAGSPAGNFGTNRPEAGVFNTYRSNTAVNTTKHAKPKDLLLMPARLALALQADGWWVRSDIIWHKPNPMPESCTDRPTSAHEHVFLLSRSAKYYYDADAVREGSADPIGSAARYDYAFSGTTGADAVNDRRTVPVGMREFNGTRNLRNVWTIATHAYPDAHFATFPPELAERCIKAGTSERGCCAACGKPWQRIVEKTPVGDWRSSDRSADLYDGAKGGPGGVMPGWEPARTTGWSPGCQCHGHFEDRPAPPDWISDETGERKLVRVWVPDGDAPKPVPCVVLDPFAGAGTTLLVADRQQRDCIGIDLNVDYTRMAMDRCIADAPLFTSFPPAEPPEDERMADLFTDMAAD